MSGMRQSFLCDAVAAVQDDKLFITVSKINDGVEFETGPVGSRPHRDQVRQTQGRRRTVMRYDRCASVSGIGIGIAVTVSFLFNQ